MPQLPRIIHTIEEITSWRRSVSEAIGFVPTMGALHEGHAALLRKSRSRSQLSVLSIFVNPTQFGPQEDLSKYPRTFEQDLQIAAREGVDVVFAPTPHEIYPQGFSTYVEETQLEKPLCGQFRPGHFKGVTTVVLKLLNLIRPQVAFFGLKDAQQYLVIRKMVEDLNLDVQVEGVPTIRESDGLALSSRNVYLSPEERKLAPKLYECLQLSEQKIRQVMRGEFKPTDLSIEQITALSVKILTENGFRVQYFECLPLDTLHPEGSLVHPNQSHLLAVAAYLGRTRLIDNIIIYP